VFSFVNELQYRIARQFSLGCLQASLDLLKGKENPHRYLNRRQRQGSERPEGGRGSINSRLLESFPVSKQQQTQTEYGT
jgi:hypothetical protein